MDYDSVLMYELLGNTLETWLLGLGIFIIFIILRFKLITLLINVSKQFTAKTKNTLDDKIVAVMERPLQWLVIIIGFKLSISFFTLSDAMLLTITHLIRSMLIMMVMWIVYNALATFNDALGSIARHFHSQLGESLARLLLSIFKALVIVIGVVGVFQEWGFNVSAFLASLGLVGMAFALAAKDTASNLFGSMVIFTDQPFRIGDWIKTPEVEGTIEEIGIRSTRVRTFAQALVTVPNGVLANAAILNWSKMGKRQIKMTLGLTYATTSQQMQSILEEMRCFLKEDDAVHPETIYIHFTEFQESALGIFCYFFTKTTNWGEYMAVRERINLEFMKIVESNGASFAFPSHSLYIERGHDALEVVN